MKKIYAITNQDYQFDRNEFAAVNSYLIVGNNDGEAVLNYFGENVMPHEKAMEWYESQRIPVVRVFTNGRILGLVQLKDRLNRQSTNEVVGELERELLK